MAHKEILEQEQHANTTGKLKMIFQAWVHQNVTIPTMRIESLVPDNNYHDC